MNPWKHRPFFDPVRETRYHHRQNQGHKHPVMMDFEWKNGLTVQGVQIASRSWIRASREEQSFAHAFSDFWPIELNELCRFKPLNLWCFLLAGKRTTSFLIYRWYMQHEIEHWQEKVSAESMTFPSTCTSEDEDPENLTCSLLKGVGTDRCLDSQQTRELLWSRGRSHEVY
jgi:hypothetical protein